MHPAKLLSRLNPATVRYDIGRGGMPELTGTDVAMALGFVGPGLGRELLCRLWWPDGAALSARDLDRLLMDAQLTEWRARADALVTAQLAAGYAESRDQRARAEAGLAEAKARMWPRLGPDSCYEMVRAAVLAEMSAECLCPACRGRGFLLVDAKVAACRYCQTTGRARVSDRNRAELIGKDSAAYHRHYATVYEWTLEFCTEAIRPAQNQLRRAVSEPDKVM